MKIKYWTDYNCPYCYIANTRLKKAIEELDIDDIEVERHAFELDPEAPETVESTTLERFALKYNISINEAQQEINNISQMGRDEGIEFNYATTLFTNSRDAHRLLKLAISKKDEDIVEKLHEALFEAYFVNNEKLADHDVLIKIATNVGLQKDEVLDVLNSEKYMRDVVMDEQIAYQLGIHGVPYYIFDDRYVVPGATTTDNFKEILTKLSEEEKIESTDETVQCGNGTCRI